MSLTFSHKLVMDSKLPTERKVQKGDGHLQVRACNPSEEPADIEEQIFVNRTEYSRRLLESMHMCSSFRRLLYSHCRCRDVILTSADIHL